MNGQLLQFLESGLLELYVMGQATPEQGAEVETMLAIHHEVRAEKDAIEAALERLALANAVQPNPIIKPFLLATVDYATRLQNGEPPAFPPLLTEHSTMADYAEWLGRTDIALPEYFRDIHASIIGYTAELITAIVWIKEMAPQEVHDHEYEKFLIVEGTCDIQIEDEVHHLVPGDYLTIPLHKNHHVRITSATPCKVILQRLAA
jgi:mannose-6-phosphate isomerase-like protein (cupin superfamily)